MAYCRFSDGDVYLYLGTSGFTCCWCKLQQDDFRSAEDPVFQTSDEALDHLLKHREAGHDVPQYAIERLEDDM
jgi:hypothetical protein